VMAAINSTAAIMFSGQQTEDDTLLNDTWLLSGTVANSSTKTGRAGWLSTVLLHALVMFLGWGVFLQAGAFIARYFRHKDPWWFKMHRGLQMVGLLFAVIGFAFGIASVQSKHFSFAHGALGLIIMILGISQPINAYFRPHKTPGQP